MITISGPQKVLFAKRLGDSWQMLVTCLDIPDHVSKGFNTGVEGLHVLSWLEAQNRLDALPEALEIIDRHDLAVILRPPPDPEPSTPRWPGSPYPGLCAFSAAEAPIFCGRDRHANELVDRLKDPSHRFVAVVGASGSGKSSVVAAGVLPRLQQGAIPGSEDWIVLEFTPGGPGNDPFHALPVQLEPLLRHQRMRARDIDHKLRTGGLSALVQEALDRRDHAELVLFIDQFEELFTLCDESHRRPFIHMLSQAVSTPRLRLIITLRSDFSAHCIDKLAGLLNAGFYALPPPGVAELYEMITRPAALAGLTFEPDDLPWRILDETGTEPGALALMAFALAELYQARTPEGVLTLEAYEQLGGVTGVLGKRADETYAALATAAQEALGTVFKELVEVDAERGVPTRKRALLQSFTNDPAALDLIEALTEARLLVCSSPEDHGVPMVEVAHEALLRHWALLKDWIEARFDDFRLLRQVKNAAAEWERFQRESHYLWPHERLVPVAKMLDNLQLQQALSHAEQEFVRPESERLLRQIDDRNTSHQERVKIGDRLADIGDPRSGVGLNRDQLPEFVWCEVPGGKVTLEDNAGAFDVTAGYISKYPVTWAQYRCFLQANDGYANADWWEGLAEREDKPGQQYRELDNHPAEHVSWYDAVAYCRWLSAKLSYEIRLPTEWEWQQAATVGNPAHEYPWGADWDAALSNTYECRLSRTTAVGMYPHGVSPVGALDMSGNVEEWCLNTRDNPGDIDLSGPSGRVVRGGSWRVDPIRARACYRPHLNPSDRRDLIGFRVWCSSPIRF